MRMEDTALTVQQRKAVKKQVATKFDFNTSILVLVFVVLGGLGNLWGSVIAAAALTLLPELLRSFSDYRMLLYSVILILIMLMTHAWLKGSFRQTVKAFILKRREQGKGAAIK